MTNFLSKKTTPVFTKQVALEAGSKAVTQLTFFALGMFLLVYTLNVYLHFDRAQEGFGSIHHHSFSSVFITDLVLGMDGLSLVLLVLTAFIFPTCYVMCRSIGAQATPAIFGLFLFFLFAMEGLLLLIFQFLDLFFFYFSFEAVLIPMYMLIGKWGSRERRIKAAYYFFLYTLVTSMFVFVSIFYISSTLGSTLYPLLSDQPFSFTEETYLCLAFFITFATKVPMLPFHIWLPEAHVESPTVGSVILAALLLKLGGFGFLRFSLPVFVEGNRALVGLVYILAVVGIIYSSLTTIRQFDLKKIVAYSSVAHMNLSILGLYAFTQQGLDGSVYLMLGHGIVSSALFFCIGVLYDRHHTRLLYYYGGMVTMMPLFAFVFFIFTLANMGFPGTVNFIGEFLVYTGIYDRNALVGILATPAIIFSAVYSGWLYNRVMFGTLKTQYIVGFSDMNRIETGVLMLFALATIYFGVSSMEVLDTIYPATKNIVLYY